MKNVAAKKIQRADSTTSAGLVQPGVSTAHESLGRLGIRYVESPAELDLRSDCE